MNRKNMIPVLVWMTVESLKEIGTGHVSRGSIRQDEDGQLVHKKYKLGEGKKIGPRKPKQLTQAPEEEAAAMTFKVDITIHLVVDQLGELASYLLEPLAVPMSWEKLGSLAELFNLDNKGGKNANN